jgi:oxygen-dependent protoporphyrinogen oxidase
VDLYEASDRLGGVIRTEWEDDFLLDTGPDSLVTFKPWAIDLCRELGLGAELVPVREETAGVDIYARGRLRRLPTGGDRTVAGRALAFLTSGLMSWPGLMRMAGDLVLPGGPERAEESMAEFFGRRLGREAVARLVDPLLAGIYAGDPDRLSIRSTFPRFVDLEARHRSLALGMLRENRARHSRRRGSGDERRGPIFYSLVRGLGRLVDALGERLSRRVTVHLEAGVRGVTRRGETYVLETAVGPVECDLLVLATPAWAAAGILRPLDAVLADRLAAIRYVGSATVFFGYRAADLSRVPSGHGFLVPQSEGRRINGATWVSNKYPHRSPADGFLARCYVGGDRGAGEAELDDPVLIDLCRDELAGMAGMDADPQFARVFRFPRSNPQYEVGHTDRVAAIEAARAGHAGLYLTGGAYRGVGVADGVRDGRATARSLVEALTTSATVSGGR